MEENTKNLKIAELEALLFVHGEAIDAGKVAKVLEVGEEEARTLLADLEKLLESEGRGLRLVSDRDRFQLVTKPMFAGILEKFVKEELTEELTPASLEALSLVSYLGPIARSRLEFLRGVNSVFTLRNLMLRGLLTRFPDPKRLNSYLYKPSLELLKHLGLGRVQDLPDYDKFRGLLEGFEKSGGQILTDHERSSA